MYVQYTSTCTIRTATGYVHLRYRYRYRLLHRYHAYGTYRTVPYATADSDDDDDDDVLVLERRSASTAAGGDKGDGPARAIRIVR